MPQNKKKIIKRSSVPSAPLPYRPSVFLESLRFFVGLLLGIVFASLMVILAWLDYHGVWNRAAMGAQAQLLSSIKDKDQQIDALQTSLDDHGLSASREPLRVGMKFAEAQSPVFATSSGGVYPVVYSNKDQGLSMVVSYDPGWGSGERFTLPFEEQNSAGRKTVFFGSYGLGCIGEACVGYRSMDMVFLPARTQEMALKDFYAQIKNLPKGVPVSSTAIKVGDVRGMRFEMRTMSQSGGLPSDATDPAAYTVPQVSFEIFGKKANYLFHGPEDEVLKVIKTIKFL